MEVSYIASYGNLRLVGAARYEISKKYYIEKYEQNRENIGGKGSETINSDI